MRFMMNFKKLPRCGAKTRSNEYKPCRQAAMKNGRCYYHGESMTIKHGNQTKIAKQQHFDQRALIKNMRQMLVSIKQQFCHDE